VLYGYIKIVLKGLRVVRPELMVCFSLGVQGIASVAVYVEHVQNLCCSILILADTEQFVYNIHFGILLYVNA